MDITFKREVAGEYSVMLDGAVAGTIRRCVGADDFDPGFACWDICLDGVNDSDSRRTLREAKEVTRKWLANIRAA